MSAPLTSPDPVVALRTAITFIRAASLTCDTQGQAHLASAAALIALVIQAQPQTDDERRARETAQWHNTSGATRQ